VYIVSQQATQVYYLSYLCKADKHLKGWDVVYKVSPHGKLPTPNNEDYHICWRVLSRRWARRARKSAPSMVAASSDDEDEREDEVQQEMAVGDEDEEVEADEDEEVRAVAKVYLRGPTRLLDRPILLMNQLIIKLRGYGNLSLLFHWFCSNSHLKLIICDSFWDGVEGRDSMWS
jgi:hypothetical protein